MAKNKKENLEVYPARIKESLKEAFEEGRYFVVIGIAVREEKRISSEVFAHGVNKLEVGAALKAIAEYGNISLSRPTLFQKLVKRIKAIYG